ncbi:MAG TPA: DNA polymerase IV [Acidobacteriota bacterium]|nr:DNA polymerase IV [Acidobacteriota bacterium]
MQREIIYVDIAAFAVAVERVVHPDLRNRPVVVAPVGPSRSVVTALSPEAWHAGIRKGMVVAKAVKYCREVVILPPNEPLYARASRAIFKILHDFSPVLEPSGYGHAYMDITGTDRLFGPPRDTAWRAQKEIRRRLRLDASLGVASNKLVSKIASEVTKPVGLQDVHHGDETSFLSPLPVRLLPGVGSETREQLEELNIRIIRDIAVMKLEHLTLAFGRLGFVLHQRALGIDNTPVYPERAVPAVDQEKVLPEDSNDYERLKGVVFELCERAGEQLRAEKQRAGRMELRVRYSDYREDGGKEKLVSPVQSTAALFARAEPLLERILTRRTRVRSVYLRLTELSHGSVQLELFAGPKPEKQARLESALDILRKRYGTSVLKRAS